MHNGFKKVDLCTKGGQQLKTSSDRGEGSSASFEKSHGQIIVNLATLKISDHFSMHKLREEQYEVINAAKYNGTIDTFEELDRLRQILEEKRGDAMEIGDQRYMIKNNLRHCNTFLLKREEN